MKNFRYYYPELQKKIKLKLIKKDKLYQPYKKLDFYYLEQSNEFLNIPSNSSLSEFLNKFNEPYILPLLGEYKLNQIKREQKFEIDLNDMVNNFGWNWINWNSEKGKRILYELDLIQKKIKMFTKQTIYNQTLKILGKIKLQESIDYGKKVESDIVNYLENEESIPISTQSTEVLEFLNHLDQNNFVVIGHNLKFYHPDGIFTGEIDFLLINKDTKMIHICDLKTSSEGDNFDYWRQVAIYHYVFKLLNPHLKNNISDELIIININNLKDKLKSKFYSRMITDNKLLEICQDVLSLKEKYLLSLDFFNKYS
ncbi:PD-(D/E)XK nuclease family protein [Candidatus Hepatoplasma crinochetorum]|uniref:PD-(D/E)XK endonuclease-like domain-containing protein n=1 Tax=Candidatus Hepatoplasma crinochetorum Av TaxID=1427984 RepID=W8GGG1_9MOLU|nr:PD-(D/E)XK nuclease family protein [Candidatus Hepatoplasma crinochetorum]AHK22693.1 hypothetical protein X271_00607 [Candidatus Hepatoplasma crinochetorum Av]BDV03267.1 MAG: hypothetical protein HCTKY_5610 [Candidatus Hepatoplasma crinochetorum]